jgi:DNA-binding transcriptional LysR family regulator
VAPAGRTGQVTWSRLTTFREVAERGSVRAAARALHVTEPAVSAAVAAVERQLGTSLLRREGRNVVLTEAGRTFADYCRTLIALADEAASAVRDVDRPRLRIGAVSAAAEYVLPTALVAFRRHRPDVDLTVTVLPRDELFAALSHHELDVVVAGRPPRGGGLVARASRANRLVVVGAAAEAAARGEDTWLLRSPGSGMRTVTLDLLRGLELAPELLEMGSHGAVVAAARAGLGVTLAHEDAVAGDIAAGRLVVRHVPGTPITRPWIVSTTRRATPAALDLVRLLGDESAMGEATFHLAARPRG